MSQAGAVWRLTTLSCGSLRLIEIAGDATDSVKRLISLTERSLPGL